MEGLSNKLSTTTEALKDEQLLQIDTYIHSLGGPKSVMKQWRDFMLTNHEIRPLLGDFAEIVVLGESDDAQDGRESARALIDGFSFGYALLMAPELTKLEPNFSLHRGAIIGLRNRCSSIANMAHSDSQMSSRPEVILEGYGEYAARRFKGFHQMTAKYQPLLSSLGETTTRVRRNQFTGMNLAAHMFLHIKQMSIDVEFIEIMKANGNWLDDIEIEGWLDE